MTPKLSHLPYNNASFEFMQEVTWVDEFNGDICWTLEENYETKRGGVGFYEIE